MAGKVSAVPRKNFVVEETINPNMPPLRVKHRKSGMCTSWSTLFTKRIGEFLPYFRTEEEYHEYRVKLRRWEAAQALRGGDPYAGMEMRTSLSFDDDAGSELAELA